MAKRESNEFFYLDEAGNKQDAELHQSILAPVDYPIDEKIMKPIRAKHRAQAQRAKRYQALKRKFFER